MKREKIILVFIFLLVSISFSLMGTVSAARHQSHSLKHVSAYIPQLKPDGAECISDYECESKTCDYDIFTSNYAAGKINTGSSAKYCHSDSSKCLFYAGNMEENNPGCTRCASWFHDGGWDDFIATCGQNSKWESYDDCNGDTPYCDSSSENSCHIKCVECRNDNQCQGDSKCINNECIFKEISCIDSDGGMNYYTSGTITGPDKDGEGNPPADYCWQNGRGVMEGFCTSDGYVNFISYECPNGCSNGACQRQVGLRLFKNLFSFR